MVDEARGADPAGPEPAVEGNGPWFAVFLVIFLVLFVSAFAALVHSLSVTFD